MVFQDYFEDTHNFHSSLYESAIFTGSFLNIANQ